MIIILSNYAMYMRFYDSFTAKPVYYVLSDVLSIIISVDSGGRLALYHFPYFVVFGPLSSIKFPLYFISFILHVTFFFLLIADAPAFSAASLIPIASAATVASCCSFFCFSADAALSMVRPINSVTRPTNTTRRTVGIAMA